MPIFTAAPHADVLAVLVQIAVLLLAARLLGGALQALGQPAVVGELLAGIVLGPSLLSGAFPAIGAWIVPGTPTAGHLLELVSLLGAIFLLVITGLETNLPLIRRQSRVALGVAAGGLAVPLATGYALGSWLPDELLADPAQRTIFAFFVATAMSISAIPVIAKILMDLDLLRREVGQTILAAAMIDDTTGWILLSIIAGLAAGEAASAATALRAVGSVAFVLALTVTVGAWLVKRSLDWIEAAGANGDRVLSLVVVLVFGWSALTHALRLEPVLGAFLMAILLGREPRVSAAVRRQLHDVGLAIFAPIFFAVAGLKVSVTSLADPGIAAIALLVIAVATFGKVAGTYLGARWIGRADHWTALAYGAGLNARGAMEIIVATIGLRLGILSQEMFSIIVIMAMATSLMAPFALRWTLRRARLAGATDAGLPRAEELARR